MEWIKVLVEAARGAGFVIEGVRPGGIELVRAAGGTVSITSPLIGSQLIQTILVGSTLPWQCSGRTGDAALAPRCESYAGHPGAHFIRPKKRDDDD